MIAKFNYAQRWLATATLFALFGLGGLFVSQILFRFGKTRASSLAESQAQAKKTVQKAFLIFMRLASAIGAATFEFRGLEKMERDEGCLVLANHPSLIDAVALMAVCPNSNCIVKEGLWQNPFLRDIVSGAGYIKSTQGEDVLGLAEVSIKKGENLVIFPEGTRTVPNQPLRLKRGAAHVALRLQRPIRLVHISMSPTTLTKSEKWYRIPPQRPHMVIEVGEIITPELFPSSDLLPSIRARRLNRLIQEKLEKSPI